MTLDPARTRTLVQQAWDREIIPALTDYIRIPAKSPMYDAKWAEHGHIERAVTLMTDWARGRKIEGLTIDVIRLEGRTPVILMEVPGKGGEPVILLMHEPDVLPEVARYDVDLMLSGHTHGGQVRLPFLPPLLLTYSTLDPSHSRLQTLDPAPVLNLAEVNGNVQFADIDGDGLPDIFQTTDFDQRFMLNRGESAGPGSPLVFSAPVIQPRATAM